MANSKSRFATILSDRGFQPMQMAFRGRESDPATRARAPVLRGENTTPAKRFTLHKPHGASFLVIDEDTDQPATFAWDEMGGVWFKADADALNDIGFQPVSVIEREDDKVH